jgi:hypothetical protein
VQFAGQLHRMVGFPDFPDAPTGAITGQKTSTFALRYAPFFG